MRLTLNKNLDPLKIAALKEIDTKAEEVRGYFVTLGAAQSMVYLEKRREAEMVAAATVYDPDTGEPVTDIPVSEIPALAAEATMNGVSLLDMAADILTQSYSWATVAAQIETMRLSAKEAVRVATNPAQIDTAKNVDWSPIINMAPSVL